MLLKVVSNNLMQLIGFLTATLFLIGEILNTVTVLSLCFLTYICQVQILTGTLFFNKGNFRCGNCLVY